MCFKLVAFQESKWSSTEGPMHDVICDYRGPQSTSREQGGLQRAEEQKTCRTSSTSKVLRRRCLGIMAPSREDPIKAACKITTPNKKHPMSGAVGLSIISC